MTNAIEIPEIKLSKCQIAALKALRDRETGIGAAPMSENRNWRKTLATLVALECVDLVFANGFGRYALTNVGRCELAIAEGLWS